MLANARPCSPILPNPQHNPLPLTCSIALDGRAEDPHSMHEGCPVEKGAKWTTTIWIHPMPFRPYAFRNHTSGEIDANEGDPRICSDLHSECKGWAAAGECDKNPLYMKGDRNQLGKCLASCGACEACTAQDKQARASCYWHNRRKHGYLVFDPKEIRFKRQDLTT